MKIDLISDSIKHNEYFVIMHGTYSGKKLSVLNNDLNLITEFPFEGIEVWDSNFHTLKTDSNILISITATGTYPLESKKYQGYSTLWFRLNLSDSNFSLDKIDEWDRSDIRAIKSKNIDGQLYWIGLRDLNFINQRGNIGRRTLIGFTETDKLEIPEFNFTEVMQHSHLYHDFDFTVHNKEITLSAIAEITNSVPTILRFSKDFKNQSFTKLEIPLRKLHNFLSTKIVSKEDKLLGYFWTSSSEQCKKYFFELYVAEINLDLKNSIVQKAIDEEYVHSFKWNNSIVAYKVGDQSAPCKLGAISENGIIKEFLEIENSNPILLSNNNELISAELGTNQLVKNYI